MRLIPYALAASLAALSAAYAGTYTSVTVGTTDATILTDRKTHNALDIVNNSPSATVCINFGAVATISGTTCAAGEITLPPLWHRSWDVPLVPYGDVHAISSAVSTPVSIAGN